MLTLNCMHCYYSITLDSDKKALLKFILHRWRCHEQNTGWLFKALWELLWWDPEGEEPRPPPDETQRDRT